MTLAQRFEECRRRVVDGLERGFGRPEEFSAGQSDRRQPCADGNQSSGSALLSIQKLGFTSPSPVSTGELRTLRRVPEPTSLFRFWF